MSVWNEIRKEFSDSQHKTVRQKYIQRYVEATGNNFICYATEFTSGSKPDQLLMIVPADKQIFADVMRDLDNTKTVDIMIESPGGIGTAAEAIAHMLHSRFPKVRFIIPNMAKSAATVLCLSGNEILMNEQSELGPIDPQMPVRQPNKNITFSPAHLILQQFGTMVQTLKADDSAGRLLAPYLQIYFPSLLQECQNAKELIKTISEDLLKKYMFAEDSNKESKAKHVAKTLSEFQNHLSHSRSLNIDYCTNELGLNVFDLRTDKDLDLIVNQIYLAIKETFNRNPRIVKLCEGNNGQGTLLQLN